MDITERCRDHSQVLYQNPDGSIVLLDIPRSLEESQQQAGFSGFPQRRIYSSEPVSEPLQTPEPRHGGTAHQSQSPAAQVADLMSAATVDSALQALHEEYQGPFCLSRLSLPLTAQTVSGDPYIPHGSKYIQGDIESTRQQFVESAPKFDLIVLDPPWPNRSVRRAKKYETAAGPSQTRQLLSLIPVPSHLASDGLVAIWITNSSNVLGLVTSRSGLLTSWGLELAVEWTWVKITSSGEPIYDVDSRWRKPWEKLLIARRIGSRKHAGLQSKIIFAVPDLHSRKPNLRLLFQSVLGDEYTGLEVFARNLTASWWAWGNEVLNFQREEHWAVNVLDNA
ncbi:hypothetical protein HJFPF1_06282 [Paramyrothecium foliicola]|nr:hypothetical protein HJFPF1_06282 [Paramyrothecium foliicola]